MKPTANELQLQLQNKLVEDLAEKHREIATLTNLLDDVVYRCDESGNFTFLNGAWVLRTGWDIDLSIGKKLADYLSEPELKDELQLEFAENESVTREIEILCKNEGTKTFQLNARKSGESWYGSLHDVTEQRKVMRALQKSQEKSKKLSLVASRTDNMVVISDRYGRIEWVNHSFERITGYKLFELKGHNASEFLQGELTDPRTVKEMRTGLEEGLGFAVEIINYNMQGESYWVSIDCNPVFDDNGELINFVAIQREISERKLAESTLKNSETTLKGILDTVNEPIFRCDSNLNIHFVNTAWQLTTGHTLSSERTVSLLHCIHPEDHETLINTKIRALSKLSESKCELRLKNTEGEWRRIELVLTSNNSELNDDTLLTGAIIDIHERWLHTQAILQAKEQAEELSRDRTRFVANMSHEIRTPLNAIIGMSSVLEATELCDKQRTCVETITNGGKALIALVHDVLDLSKLDAEKIELEESRFRVLALCEESVDMVAAKVEEKALRLRLVLANALPASVIGDANKIRQVLINLLSNAVKFTDTGEIQLEVNWQSLSEKEGHLQFTVSDSGIGIAADKLEALFEPFSQADPSITRRFGGTGLGLAISHQICEAMGGEIIVNSNVGEGTQFSVSMPLVIDKLSTKKLGTSLKTVNLPEHSKPVVDSLSHCQGMIVEHNQDSTTPPSISLVDDQGVVASSLPFDSIGLVLTPLRIWRKLSIINHSKKESRRFDDDDFKSGLRILVAEDVLANQVVIKMMLSQLGFKNVTVVEHGELATSFIERSPVDVVILDIHMPVMDGITASRIIRDNKGINQPVIIAASADVTTDAKKAAVDAGIDHWLPKPLNRGHLEKVLRQLVKEGLVNSVIVKAA